MEYDAELNFNYFSPTKVIFGQGSISELPMEVGALGQKVFLVTDPGLIEAGLVEPGCDDEEVNGPICVHTSLDNGLGVLDAVGATIDGLRDTSGLGDPAGVIK